VLYKFLASLFTRNLLLFAQFCLTSTGLLCVGGAFILAVAICSLIGIPYGPIHTSLPFLLLGLGIDDIFVFNASWKQIHTYESNLKKPLTKRIGLTLGHAGSAITITSFTDVVAFIIGSSTVCYKIKRLYKEYTRYRRISCKFFEFSFLSRYYHRFNHFASTLQ